MKFRCQVGMLSLLSIKWCVLHLKCKKEKLCNCILLFFFRSCKSVYAVSVDCNLKCHVGISIWPHFTNEHIIWCQIQRNTSRIMYFGYYYDILRFMTTDLLFMVSKLLNYGDHAYSVPFRSDDIKWTTTTTTSTFDHVIAFCVIHNILCMKWIMSRTLSYIMYDSVSLFDWMCHLFIMRMHAIFRNFSWTTCSHTYTQTNLPKAFLFWVSKINEKIKLNYFRHYSSVACTSKYFSTPNTCAHRAN